MLKLDRIQYMAIVVGCLPAGYVFYRAFGNTLGLDPLASLQTYLGYFAIAFFASSVVIAGLNSVFSNRWTAARKTARLLAYLHLAALIFVYCFLKRQGDLSQILNDLTKLPYVSILETALLLSLPAVLLATAIRWKSKRSATP